MAKNLNACVDSAIIARQSLIDNPEIEAYRVFNGKADGFAGLVIEKLGEVLIVQIHQGQPKIDLQQVRSLVERVHEELGTRAVYKKTFVRDRAQTPEPVAQEHSNPKPWIGSPVEPDQTINEHGLRFIVRPYDGFSVGLFLEHRDNRQRIRELAAGRRVLNAFSYTGGFSVASASGGALSVASVDLSKHYLEWSKQNFATNNLDQSDHLFFCSDIFDFYKRAERQGRRFDLIILDPPTFARMSRPKRTFVLDEQLNQLLVGAISLLDPGGIILLATNHRQIDHDRLQEELAAAAPGRSCTITEKPPLPLDFAGDPEYSKTIIARFD